MRCRQRGESSGSGKGRGAGGQRRHNVRAPAPSPGRRPGHAAATVGSGCREMRRHHAAAISNAVVTACCAWDASGPSPAMLATMPGPAIDRTWLASSRLDRAGPASCNGKEQVEYRGRPADGRAGRADADAVVRSLLVGRGHLADPGRGAGQPGNLVEHGGERGLRWLAGSWRRRGSGRRGSRCGCIRGCNGAAGHWPRRAGRGYRSCRGRPAAGAGQRDGGPGRQQAGRGDGRRGPPQ